VTTGVRLVVYVTGKDLAKKKKITMVKPFAGSSGMDIFDIAAPPGKPFVMGSPRTHTKDSIQLLKPAKKKNN
jgi:hypothetical protein